MNSKDSRSRSDVAAIFRPLVGLNAWEVKAGFGAFLTMEFGAPHLRVREPRTASDRSSAKVKRGLSRRAIFVCGDWHLFIEFAEWKITTRHGSTTSEMPKRQWRPLLYDLSGQRLLSAASPQPGHLKLDFDLGGKLEVWPDPEIKNDVWTLHPWDGDIIGVAFGGTIARESANDGREPPTDDSA